MSYYARLRVEINLQQDTRLFSDVDKGIIFTLIRLKLYKGQLVSFILSKLVPNIR